MLGRDGSSSAGEETAYTAEEWEFIQAMAGFQKRNRVRYPAWSQVLAVLVALGYRKVAPPGPPPVLDVRAHGEAP